MSAMMRVYESQATRTIRRTRNKNRADFTVSKKDREVYAVYFLDYNHRSGLADGAIGVCCTNDYKYFNLNIIVRRFNIKI